MLGGDSSQLLRPFPFSRLGFQTRSAKLALCSLTLRFRRSNGAQASEGQGYCGRVVLERAAGGGMRPRHRGDALLLWRRGVPLGGRQPS